MSNDLIAGPDNVFICNFCVDLCYGLLSDEDGEEPEIESNLEFEPAACLHVKSSERLDEYVVGQHGR